MAERRFESFSPSTTRWPAPLPPAGMYRLTIRVSRAAVIRVGRLGQFLFPAGIYVYCGSAQRALPARIARHLRRRGKTLRWHIDYLLALPAARVMQVDAWPARKDGECRLVRQARRHGGQVVAPGFGASDCPAGCGAHLLWMGT